jgi:hypothetical protein
VFAPWYPAVRAAGTLLVDVGEPDLLIGLADWVEPRLTPAGAAVWDPADITARTRGVLDWVRPNSLLSLSKQTVRVGLPLEA